MNGKISLILIFSIHSPETFFWHFKQNLQVFQLPLVAKYLSTEATLGSTLSKKTTDLDQGKAWKAHSLIWELFFTPCLLTNMVVRQSLSMLTDPDPRSETKRLWSPADEPAFQTTVPAAVHLCASDSWAVHSGHSLGRGLSFFWQDAKLHTLGTPWQNVWSPGYLGKRRHWWVCLS